VKTVMLKITVDEGRGQREWLADLGRPPVTVRMATHGHGFDQRTTVAFKGPGCDIDYDDVVAFHLEEMEI
jgi:hypothetical protein